MQDDDSKEDTHRTQYDFALVDKADNGQIIWMTNHYDDGPDVPRFPVAVGHRFRFRRKTGDKPRFLEVVGVYHSVNVEGEQYITTAEVVDCEPFGHD